MDRSWKLARLSFRVLGLCQGCVIFWCGVVCVGWLIRERIWEGGGGGSRRRLDRLIFSNGMTEDMDIVVIFIIIIIIALILHLCYIILLYQFCIFIILCYSGKMCDIRILIAWKIKLLLKYSFNVIIFLFSALYVVFATTGFYLINLYLWVDIT